jgi:hypothetical protein
MSDSQNTIVVNASVASSGQITVATPSAQSSLSYDPSSIVVGGSYAIPGGTFYLASFSQAQLISANGALIGTITLNPDGSTVWNLPGLLTPNPITETQVLYQSRGRLAMSANRQAQTIGGKWGAAALFVVAAAGCVLSGGIGLPFVLSAVTFGGATYDLLNETLRK